MNANEHIICYEPKPVEWSKILPLKVIRLQGTSDNAGGSRMMVQLLTHLRMVGPWG